MVINVPTGGNAGDLSRAVTHEMDQSWPNRVELRLIWRDAAGVEYSRYQEITAEQFFGSGGAPIAGDFVVGAIERMRRMGPPVPPLVVNGANKLKRNAKKKRLTRTQVVAQSSARNKRRKSR